MPSMLLEGQRVVTSAQSKPLWLYPNLLSLDAPLVAVAWLGVFAKTWRVSILSWQAYTTLALVVWIIYATDRLLDASLSFGHQVRTKARHDFHRRYQPLFRFALLAASLSAAFLIVTGLSIAIYSYAVIGLILVAVFFALSFYSTSEPDEIPYAKNIVAGVTFAYGCAILAISETGFDWSELVFSAELACFAALCTLNISAIDLWEQANRSPNSEANATDEIALTLPLILLAAAALFFTWHEGATLRRPFFYAILTGTGLLHMVNRNRQRYSMDALRVLADVALLLPILVFNAFSQP